MAKMTEVIRRVRDDKEGVCLEVRPDGSGWIELSAPDEESQQYFGKIRLTMDTEMAKELGAALIASAGDAQRGE